jgi:uncharacterized protein (TIGR03435 family)
MEKEGSIMCRLIPAVVLMMAEALFGQAPGPRFEVVSVKIAAPRTAADLVMGGRSGGPGTDNPEHITWRGNPVGFLIRSAYGVKRQQIVGPEWLMTYDAATIVDVQANVAPGTTWEQVNAMTRTMLEERFGLKVRREMRERDVYVLTAKPGAKIAGGNEVDTSSPGYKRRLLISGRRDGGVALAGHATTEGIASAMEMELTDESAIVIDRTGLKGIYEFDIHYSNEKPGTNDPKWPSLYTALSDAGLKLERKKEAVEVLVVDHVEKAPTSN